MNRRQFLPNLRDSHRHNRILLGDLKDCILIIGLLSMRIERWRLRMFHTPKEAPAPRPDLVDDAAERLGVPTSGTVAWYRPASGS